MKTQFDDWLAQLRRAGKGPVSINIDRGLPYSWSFTLRGNFTGSVLASSLRLSPDAGGATLVDFTAASPVYLSSEGETLFNVSLTKTQTAALPADADGDGLLTLAFDTLLTPSGGTQFRLFGGTATIAGKVTNAA